MVIGMQTTGESATKQSQEFDDVFSSPEDKDIGGLSGDEEDFISSPAMTLQNVILKCFPQPSVASIPTKERKKYENIRLAQLEQQLLSTSTEVLGEKRGNRSCKQTSINYASDGLDKSQRRMLAGYQSSSSSSDNDMTRADVKPNIVKPAHQPAKPTSYAAKSSAPVANKKLTNKKAQEEAAHQQEMLAEGWEFSRGVEAPAGAAATVKERLPVGSDCRRFFDGESLIVLFQYYCVYLTRISINACPS